MLTAEHDSESMVSRVISVDTLEMMVTTGGDKERSGDTESLDTGAADLGLVVMVWEVMDTADLGNDR